MQLRASWSLWVHSPLWSWSQFKKKEYFCLKALESSVCSVCSVFWRELSQAAKAAAESLWDGESKARRTNWQSGQVTATSGGNLKGGLEELSQNAINSGLRIGFQKSNFSALQPSIVRNSGICASPARQADTWSSSMCFGACRCSNCSKTGGILLYHWNMSWPGHSQKLRWSFCTMAMGQGDA